MAADSALGGVLEKIGDHLHEKTRAILKEVQAKFQSKHGAAHESHGGTGGHHGGNGGSGHDTLTGGHDTMVGGHDSGVCLTDLGAVKLPDLSWIKAVGGVAPVDPSTIIPSAASAADAVIAKVAPAVHVDLTLIGQSVDALTKKLSKLVGGS
jgi:hypothetical protein